MTPLCTAFSLITQRRRNLRVDAALLYGRTRLTNIFVTDPAKRFSPLLAGVFQLVSGAVERFFGHQRPDRCDAHTCAGQLDRHGILHRLCCKTDSKWHAGGSHITACDGDRRQCGWSVLVLSWLVCVVTATLLCKAGVRYAIEPHVDPFDAVVGTDTKSMLGRMVRVG